MGGEFPPPFFIYWKHFTLLKSTLALLSFQLVWNLTAGKLSV